MTEDSAGLSPNLKVIGRYSLLRELRRERNTVSYAAVDPVMNRELVVKAVQLVRGGSALSDDELQKVEQAFVRQAQAAGRLHHPHIVTVFDAGRSHEYGYLVIERVAGRPLHELLARGLRPEFVQCASIAARICDALAYAHQQGVAHRHLGPQHVFLMADGVPKVAGFGGWIDTGASGDAALARSEDLLPYFDSELTDADRQADARAAAGLLYMMLTGRAPAPAGASAVHSSAQAGERPLPVQWLRADTPPELARLVDAALDPLAARAPSPGELRDELTAFVWNQPAAGVAPATIGIPLAAPPDRTDRGDGSGAAPASPSATTAAKPALPTLPRTAGPSERARAPTASFHVPLVAPGAPPAQAPEQAESAAPDVVSADPVASRPGAGPPVPRARWQALLDPLRDAYSRNRFSAIAFALVLVFAAAIGLALGSSGRRSAAPAPVKATAAAPAERAAPEPAVAASGTVHLEVSPWGEVLVDNRPVGVAPPMGQLTLSPGRHMIEIRHPDHPSWTGQVDIDATRPVVIRHRFE